MGLKSDSDAHSAIQQVLNAARVLLKLKVSLTCTCFISQNWHFKI